MDSVAGILQVGFGPADPLGGSSIDLAFSLGGGAISAFVTTLVFGAILVAVFEEYTLAKMEMVQENPVGTFLYGFASLVFLGLVIVVLAITIIGLLVAVPLAIATWVVWSAGAAIGYLVIADRLLGHEDGWVVPLVVAAALNGGLTLTGIGAILSFCVGAAGFGAILRGYLGD